MEHEATVLVVDDEKVIRDGCARLLNMELIRVVTAANGKEALEILAKERVDAILCDLKMPVMGAIEVLEATCRDFTDIPVVIITGHGTVENAVECMKKGAYDFVTKPFRGDHLVLVTKRAIEKHRLQREAQALQEERAKNLYDLATEKSRIRAVVNCMAEGVLVTNRHLEVVLYNPALQGLLDLPGELQSIDVIGERLGSERLVESLRQLLAQPPAEGEHYVSQEFNRESLHLRCLSTLIPGPEREILGTVTVFQDVTRFVELNEMKSNFVHMVSHELRSPLAAIQQQHTVLLKGMAGELNEAQRRLLQRARQKIEGLLQLINDLLDVAKMESGQDFMVQKPVDIRPILEDTLALFDAKAKEQGIELRLELPSEMPLVFADKRSMEEVFINLVSNAINYSPDGGEVTVSAHCPSDSMIEIRVQDTGIGIDPEEIPKIFDKFYRVKHPKTRQVVGTGLGLSLVKSIIDAHRGSIKVDSRPGVGTAFRLLIPSVVEGDFSNYGKSQ